MVFQAEIRTTPANSEPNRNPALDIFHKRFEQFKSDGEDKLIFLTYITHETCGMSPCSYDQEFDKDGVLNFSDKELVEAANIFSDELTGKEDTLKKLDELIYGRFGAEIGEGKLGGETYNLEIETLEKNIKMGIEIDVGEQGESQRHYQLVKTQTE